MEKMLPVSKRNKTRKFKVSHNILYKKTFVHKSFYKFRIRRPGKHPFHSRSIGLHQVIKMSLQDFSACF